MRGRFFLDSEGRQRSFPRVSDRAGPTEGVGTEVTHDETAKAEFPDSPDTLWVLSDPLDDDFGQTVESSSVLHAIGDRGLSLGGSLCVSSQFKKLENSADGLSSDGLLNIHAISLPLGPMISFSSVLTVLPSHVQFGCFVVHGRGLEPYVLPTGCQQF